jgi:integrase/recombinase XerD
MNNAKQLHATEPISPLRQRMIDDMNMRRLNPKTQSDYLLHVKRFSEFFGHSPHKATAEDLRQYQLHLVSSGIKSTSINAVITALRFLFTITLDRQEAVKKLCPIHEPRILPEILSPEDVTRTINATHAFKYKAVLSVAYGTGLRAKEVCHLSVDNIDNANMVLHVEQGKGSKDRLAMLSLPLLTILRRWWCIARKQELIREGG